MWLFLGAWIAVLMAGYMASRASVFAAGGYTDCIDCSCCMNAEILWLSSSGGYAGDVDNGTNTPDDSAAYGPDCSNGNPMIWGTNFCDSVWLTTGVTLEAVFYNSATPCTYIPGPPPPGNYTCTDGQGMRHTGVTFPQVLCGP